MLSRGQLTFRHMAAHAEAGTCSGKLQSLPVWPRTGWFLRSTGSCRNGCRRALGVPWYSLNLENRTREPRQPSSLHQAPKARSASPTPLEPSNAASPDLCREQAAEDNVGGLAQSSTTCRAYRAHLGPRPKEQKMSKGKSPNSSVPRKTRFKGLLWPIARAVSSMMTSPQEHLAVSGEALSYPNWVLASSRGRPRMLPSIQNSPVAP